MSESPEEPSLLRFPCEFPIKIMGKATDEFEVAVLDILKRHIPNADFSELKNRYSSNREYLSLSLTLPLDSKAQLDSLYIELSQHPLVLMVL